jgi:hypothetical protein
MGIFQIVLGHRSHFGQIAAPRPAEAGEGEGARLSLRRASIARFRLPPSNLSEGMLNFSSEA